MNTVTIPAREVKAGDVLTILGVEVAVGRDAVTSASTPNRVRIDWPEGFFWVVADLPLTVTRPDPDAELVEVMARAMGDRIEVHWRMEDFDQQTPADQENTRRDVRAALAAAREAGLL